MCRDFEPYCPSPYVDLKQNCDFGCKHKPPCQPDFNFPPFCPPPFPNHDDCECNQNCFCNDSKSNLAWFLSGLLISDIIRRC